MARLPLKLSRNFSKNNKRYKIRQSEIDNPSINAARQVLRETQEEAARGAPNRILTTGLPVMAMEAAFQGALKAGWQISKTAAKGLWKTASIGARRFKALGLSRISGEVVGGIRKGFKVTARSGFEGLRGAKQVVIRDVHGLRSPLSKDGALDWAHAGMVNLVPVAALGVGISLGGRSADLNAQIGRVALSSFEDSIYMGATPNISQVRKNPLRDIGADGQLALALHHLRQG